MISSHLIAACECYPQPALFDEKVETIYRGLTKQVSQYMIRKRALLVVRDHSRGHLKRKVQDASIERCKG